MCFTLSKEDKEISIIIDNSENEAVKIAAENLKRDLNKAFNCNITETAEKKIRIAVDYNGDYKWEQYKIRASCKELLITGGDRRGVIYGIYTLSKMCGVSPWYYFADVPVNAPEKVEFKEGQIITDYPAIQYRGIFINDEEELDKWARLHMNEPTIGYNTYEKVFELLLRLGGNYIWPAMHVNSFNMQPESGALADRMGVVVGTSHCDMLMRSNFREWEPWLLKKGYKNVKYDYSFEGENREALKEYWRESVEQNKDFEVSYTLGMRGIHDSGFDTEALKADSEEALINKKCELLETVINDQKEILDSVLNKDTLKIFVPYKEVLSLYDKGLRVPKDVTLIWTNDNYGYVRRYPSESERLRAGGNGIYYHNSYWAPTENHYLFISSNPIAKIHYEMSKAYEKGIRKLWVCNMGAIKPLEQEMEYFLSLAWNIDKEKDVINDSLKYLEKWVKDNFKSVKAPAEVAKLLNTYALVTDTRKVEFMEDDVFSLDYENEAAIRVNTLKYVFDELNKIYEALSAPEKDAFFELILMKVHASYYTNALYYFADSSYKYKDFERLADKYSDISLGFENLRRKLLYYYNKKLCNGKWDAILTPDDFPPPRCISHAASVPGAFAKENKDHIPDAPSVCEYAHGYAATAAELTECKIIKGIGHGTDSVVELLNENSKIKFSFAVKENCDICVEIDRYPSLNSVEKICVDASLDGANVVKITSPANDEWRGDWVKNVKDGVDRLQVKFKNVKKGNHTLLLKNASEYFAVSKIVISEGFNLKDRLGALRPFENVYRGNELPDENYLKEACEIFYSDFEIPQKPIPIGEFVNGVNVMDLTDDTEYNVDSRRLFMPDGKLSKEELLSFKNKKIKEENKHIVIEALCDKEALDKFDYCNGVSYKNSNVALYIRDRDAVFDEDTAPSLNYEFDALGGEYTIYVLMKCDSRDKFKLKLLLDGEYMPLCWDKDMPWRYEAEKVYRYVPLVKAKLSKGHHTLSLKLYAGRVFIERIIMQKGT